MHFLKFIINMKIQLLSVNIALLREKWPILAALDLFKRTILAAVLSPFSFKQSVHQSPLVTYLPIPVQTIARSD